RAGSPSVTHCTNSPVSCMDGGTTVVAPLPLLPPMRNSTMYCPARPFANSLYAITVSDSVVQMSLVYKWCEHGFDLLPKTAFVFGKNWGAKPIAAAVSRSTSTKLPETAPSWMAMFCELPSNCAGSNGRFCHSLPIGFLVLRLTGTGFQPRLAYSTAASAMV